jgi:hypothetical protein
MFKRLSHKALATSVLSFIIAYGFFKNFVLRIYSELILSFFRLIGYDSVLLISKFNDFSKKEGGRDDILGWLIYYPSYFLLHIAFIYLLFWKQKQLRHYLAIGLTVLIFLLVSLSIIGKIFEFQMLYLVSYESFQKLFGLPFILLFIEGGRILYKDVFDSVKGDQARN